MFFFILLWPYFSSGPTLVTVDAMNEFVDYLLGEGVVVQVQIPYLAQAFYVWSLHVLAMSAWVLFRYSGFLPALDVNGGVNDCLSLSVSPVTGW